MIPAKVNKKQLGTIYSIGEIQSGMELYMQAMNRVQRIVKDMVRFLVNDMPTWFANISYDSYSMIYQGQLRLGLPVSKELIKTQAELRGIASGKLALTLYHIFLHATGQARLSRSTIKQALLRELESGNVKLTENVIILTKEQLKYLSQNRLNIPKRFFHAILAEAIRRKILKESLKIESAPAYFESEIEERDQNQRGDYEIAYFKNFTEEGKEIGFRRLVSMEKVTSGDDRPSITFVPGFANNSNCYNLNNKYSMAKDFADKGIWTYLFDPRGMGINEGKFDPYYTVDTLIDYDLTSVVKQIYRRSKKKPTVLLGHSMGGIVAENMVLNWGVRQHLDDLTELEPSLKAHLDNILPPKDEAKRNISMIRSIITLGSPKFFQKTSHLIFPLVLWMNHLARIFRFPIVPVQELFWCLTQIPLVREMNKWILNTDVGELNFLFNPDNHKEDTQFAQRYLYYAMESVPLGLGFQFLKAIYNGQGFKRMDGSGFNYSDYLFCLPADVPIFHFWGAKDPLASLSNLKYSQYYPHKIKRLYRLTSADDLKKVEISGERSQMIDFIIEDANHVDLLYGKAAQEIIYPLIEMIVEKVWDNWSYKSIASKPVNKN